MPYEIVRRNVRPCGNQPEAPAFSAGEGEHLLLYDGVCGLCNRVNRFVLRRDRAGTFDFAALQSRTAREVLAPFGVDPGQLRTFYVIAGYRGADPILLERSRAALFVLRTLGGPWKALTLLGVLPRTLLDAAYDAVARRRYRLFGRFDVCPLPAPEHRRRFLDVGDGY